MAEIEWRHEGKRLVLPVAVLPSTVAINSQALDLTEALIDTGATGTGLRPDVANRLGILGRGRRRVLTANGDILVPEYRIRLGFYPGSYEAEALAPPGLLPYILDLGLLAHALHEHFPYAMLIGMDVLRHCDLSIRKDRSARLVLP